MTDPAARCPSRRGIRSTAVPSLALALACLLAAGACERAPTTVTPAALAASAGAYDGRVVRVSGVLRSYPDPEHYWIEDQRAGEPPNRVALRPHEGLAALVGRDVEVVGRFSYAPERGRRISVRSIDLATDAT